MLKQTSCLSFTLKTSTTFGTCSNVDVISNTQGIRGARHIPTFTKARSSLQRHHLQLQRSCTRCTVTGVHGRAMPMLLWWQNPTRQLLRRPSTTGADVFSMHSTMTCLNRACQRLPSFCSQDARRGGSPCTCTLTTSARACHRLSRCARLRPNPCALVRDACFERRSLLGNVAPRSQALHCSNFPPIVIIITQP